VPEDCFVCEKIVGDELTISRRVDGLVGSGGDCRSESVELMRVAEMLDDGHVCRPIGNGAQLDKLIAKQIAELVASVNQILLDGLAQIPAWRDKADIDLGQIDSQAVMGCVASIFCLAVHTKVLLIDRLEDTRGPREVCHVGQERLVCRGLGNGARGGW
jgi:hypothetical protein